MEDDGGAIMNIVLARLGGNQPETSCFKRKAVAIGLLTR